MIFTQEQTILPIVNDAAQKYGVPSALILSHIKTESAFNPNAYRFESALNTASYGLLQILLTTAQSLDPAATPELLYDPSYNISLGTALMAKNLARYGGDISAEAASYNAGSAMIGANGEFVNSKGLNNVQKYVDKILNGYDYYSKWLGNGAQTIDLTVWDVSTINPYLMGTFAILALVTIYRATKNKKMEVQYV